MTATVSGRGDFKAMSAEGWIPNIGGGSVNVVALAIAALAVVIAPTLAAAADLARAETINTRGAIIGKAIRDRLRAVGGGPVRS